MTVVFDFDKTLTTRDTHAQFMVLGGRTIFSKAIIRFRCIVLSVLHKLGYIDNNTYKQLTFNHAWCGATTEEFLSGCRQFGRTVSLGRALPYLFALPKGTDTYIVTASIEMAVSKAVPSGVTVIGTKVITSDGKVSRMGENCFGESKVRRLSEFGINNISVLFTDSYSDKPLMDVSDTVYLVSRKFVKKIK